MDQFPIRIAAPLHYGPSASAAGSHFADAGPSAFYYLRLLLRGWLIVTLSALAGLGIGVLFYRAQTKLYRVHASIEFTELNDKLLPNHGSDVHGEIYTGSGDSYLQTQMKILTSEFLLDRTLAKLSGVAEKVRAQNHSDANNLSSWMTAQAMENPTSVLGPDATASKFAAHLKVRCPDQTRIVEISCDWPDGRLAANFVNTLALEYILQNIEARGNDALQSAGSLSGQINQLKANLENSDAALQEYARGAGLIVTGEKDDLAEDKLRQVQSELTKAEADRISKESQFEMAKTLAASSLTEVLDDGPLRDYQVKLTDLNTQFAELKSTVTPSNYRYERMQARIKELESAMEKERKNIVNRLRNDFEAAADRERLLKARYVVQAEFVGKQSGKMSHYNLLKREVDTNRQLYESMLQKVKEDVVASALRASHVRIIDRAKIPEAPYSPSLPWNAGLGLSGGLLLGAVATLLRSTSNDTFQRPGDLSIQLQTNELGAIPYSPFPKSSKKIALIGQGSDCMAEVQWKDRKSIFADSFRAAVASIVFAENNPDSWLLVVTSPLSGDGKSTAVSNLAMALIEMRKRVLVIDSDFRKPSLHHFFGVPNDVGLSDLLLRDPSAASLRPSDLLKETGVPGLFVLPAGRGAENPGDLLYSPRWRQLIPMLREQFPFILIDTPPVFQLPDARVLGRMADGVILIVRANATSREDARAARFRLAQDQTPVLGTILNGWDASAKSYGA